MPFRLVIVCATLPPPQYGQVLPCQYSSRWLYVIAGVVVFGLPFVFVAITNLISLLVFETIRYLFLVPLPAVPCRVPQLSLVV